MCPRCPASRSDCCRLPLRRRCRCPQCPPPAPWPAGATQSSAPRVRNSKVVFSCVSSLLVFSAILQQPRRRPAGRGSRENQVNYNSFYNICNTIYIIGILFCRICAQLKLKQQHPPLIPDESEGDAFLTGHFFTFLQNSIRIVATCSRVALPCGSR